MTYVVYILYSEKLNRFYIGYSSDIDVRLEFHRNALTHKFTGKAKDWILFLQFECEDKKQTMAIESNIKRMKSATYIRNLKKYPEMIVALLEKYAQSSEPQ